MVGIGVVDGKVLEIDYAISIGLTVRILTTRDKMDTPDAVTIMTVPGKHPYGDVPGVSALPLIFSKKSAIF